MGLSRQEYTEELYKRDFQDQDNHDGVIINLEPDILECEVKWVLENIIMIIWIMKIFFCTVLLCILATSS